MITQNQTIKAIRDLGLSCTVVDGEFRVNFRGGREATAHYTNDREDALGTAKAMLRHRDAVAAMAACPMGCVTFADHDSRCLACNAVAAAAQ